MSEDQLRNDALCSALAMSGQLSYPNSTDPGHYQTLDFQQYTSTVIDMEEYSTQNYHSDNYSDNSSDGSDGFGACDISYGNTNAVDAYTSSNGYYQSTISTGEMYAMKNAMPMQDAYVYNQYDEAQYQQQCPGTIYQHTINGDFDDDEDSLEVPLNTQSYMDMIDEGTESHKVPNFSSIFPPRPASSKRGRPVTYNKPGHDFRDVQRSMSDDDERSNVQSRCKRGAKNILLWKFLLEELRKCQSHIKWENESLGTFKFVDTVECSRRWGKMKKKDDMNFEKLSRGIRHYYKDGLMSRKDGIRLVYKFNWERVPTPYRPRFSYHRDR